MTYKVSSGTLNLCSLTHADIFSTDGPCLRIPTKPNLVRKRTTATQTGRFTECRLLVYEPCYSFYCILLACVSFMIIFNYLGTIVAVVVDVYNV